MTGADAAQTDADEVARGAAALMWAADTASRELGMRLDEVRAGYARLSMVIEVRMVQGHGSAHGGFLFTLADSAFAFACNSYGPVTVAAHCDITFLRPAVVDDELVAEAVERERYGRNGVYDVTVRRTRDGAVIAEFRGRSRTLPTPR